MPRRFTVTEKWKDCWFRQLRPSAKLLFLYLCDQCDVAGFWEIDWQQAGFATKLKVNVLEGACKALNGKIESDGKYIRVVNFLKHQRNWPLNPENRVHQAILQILETHKNFKNKPLTSPITRGYGNGKGNGKGNRGVIKGGEYTPEFVKFWKRFKGRWSQEKDIYIKVGKFEAFAEWKKLTIEEQRRAWRAADRVSGKYTPDACRWLKRKMFDDFFTAETGMEEGKRRPPPKRKDPELVTQAKVQEQVKKLADNLKG